MKNGFWKAKLLFAMVLSLGIISSLVLSACSSSAGSTSPFTGAPAPGSNAVASPAATATSAATATTAVAAAPSSSKTVSSTPGSPVAVSPASPSPAFTPGTMSVSLEHRNIKAGEKFSVDIVVESRTGLRGIQCGLDFDPDLMKCEEVEEGKYLAAWAEELGMSTLVMPQPAIDNNRGHVSKMVIIVTGRPDGELDKPGTGASGREVAATYHFTALADGTASPKITDAALIAIPENSGGHAVDIPVTVRN